MSDSNTNSVRSFEEESVVYYIGGKNYTCDVYLYV